MVEVLSGFEAGQQSMLNLLIWSDKSLQSQNWTARSRTRNRLTVAQLRGAPDIFGFWTMGLLGTTRYSDLEESPCTYNILQSYVIKKQGGPENPKARRHTARFF